MMTSIARLNRATTGSSRHIILSKPHQNSVRTYGIFGASPKTAGSSTPISPSRGEDVEDLTRQVTALVDKGKWRLCNDGKGLEREFRFKGFQSTWVSGRHLPAFTNFAVCLASSFHADDAQDFMCNVASRSKSLKHHPEWYVG